MVLLLLLASVDIHSSDSCSICLYCHGVHSLLLEPLLPSSFILHHCPLENQADVLLVFVTDLGKLLRRFLVVGCTVKGCLLCQRSVRLKCLIPPLFDHFFESLEPFRVFSDQTILDSLVHVIDQLHLTFVELRIGLKQLLSSGVTLLDFLDLYCSWQMLQGL